MKRLYLIRLDDACPTMHIENWTRMEFILKKYEIRPMVGIVPANLDDKLKQSLPDDLFWVKARRWQSNGWTIALHGLNHIYHKSRGGLNPLWNRSEFVGLSYDNQFAKLADGKSILENNGLNIEWFFAPSHTFDANTVAALKAIGIYRISDTIALKPYRDTEMLFVPQIGGKCRKMLLGGVFTFCFHPNTMTDKDFSELEKFLEKYRKYFIGFDDISSNEIGKLSFTSRLLRFLYFTRRKLNNIIPR